jgi:hypothetical protein
MTTGAGSFITPGEVQALNIQRLESLSSIVRSIGGDGLSFDFSARCRTPECQKTYPKRRQDPDFDATCDALNPYWRCDKAAGGCGGMLQIVID